jgi:hypothetical protein
MFLIVLPTITAFRGVTPCSQVGRYLTNFMELSPSYEAANYAATQNFPAFYGTGKFITVFTRALHQSLSWARSIQPIPSHPISLKYILILSTHLRLDLPLGFHTNILYAVFFSSLHATYPRHLILLDLITLAIFGEEYELCNVWR